MSDRRPSVVIDCDPGHDDAIALIVAHAYAEVVAVTTVSGNAPVANTTANALGVLALIGADTRLHVGAAKPLTQPARHALEIHGESGLDGVDLPDPIRGPESMSAVDALLSLAQNTPDLWVVALGPLTNIAEAMRADPRWAGRIAGIVLMGGSTDGGNVTASAEFNIWADPEAAAVVFDGCDNVTMVGLNITRQVTAGDPAIENLRTGDDIAQFVGANLAAAQARLAAATGSASVALHDPVALLALTHPHLFRFSQRDVRVELSGALTRGMTVVDERVRSGGPARTRVAYDVDPARVTALIYGAVGM